jgi:N6-adenosine-specific RNA methylase IME4
MANVIQFEDTRTSQLVLYDAMVQAIAEAHSIDEVKGIRDKAVALEEYARQAKNKVLEDQCRDIRERAEREWGKRYVPAKRPAGPGRGKVGSPARPTFSGQPQLRDMGVSKTQSVKWQARAAIPEAEFQATLAAGKSTDHLVKQQRRKQQEEDLGSRQIALPDTKFGVIVEDFEWDFKVYSRETGMDRHAANHYMVSEHAHTAEEIVKYTADRFQCAADDCVLFMWATVPTLAIAIDVLRLRGFRYASNYAWGKDRLATGYWSRNKHEHLLIGVKGWVPAPAEDTQWDSLIMAPAGRHSEKPECFLEMIEGYFPNLPKIELNRRGPPRPGWFAWGNETEAAE